MGQGCPLENHTLEHYQLDRITTDRPGHMPAVLVMFTHGQTRDGEKIEDDWKRIGSVLRGQRLRQAKEREQGKGKGKGKGQREKAKRVTSVRIL